MVREGADPVEAEKRERIFKENAEKVIRRSLLIKPGLLNQTLNSENQPPANLPPTTEPPASLLPTRIPTEIMATYSFSTAMKLPELKEANAKEVRQFLNISREYYEDLNEAGRVRLLKFLANAKILGEAKTRLGQVSETETATFPAFSTALLKRACAAESAETLQVKLLSCRQGRKSLSVYTQTLKELAKRLTATMVRGKTYTKAEEAAVTATVQILTLNQFKEGVHDEVKLLVKAADPRTLEDALKVATASNLDTQ